MLASEIVNSSVIVTELVSPALKEGAHGILKLALNNIPSISDFSDPVLLAIPPGQMGGNHRHLHRELFISLDEFLELHWVDGYGSKHRHKMRDNNRVWLFEIPSNVPHAIINTSEYSSGTLLEFSDGPPLSVEHYPVL